MGVHSELAARCNGKHVLRRKSCFCGFLLGVVLGVVLIPITGSAVQRHDLVPGESGQAAAAPDRSSGVGASVQHAEPTAPGPQPLRSMESTSHGTAPGSSAGVSGPAPAHGTAPAADPHKAASAPAGHGAATVTEPGTAAHSPAGEHGAAAEGHGGHGPALPVISPIPGVSFVEAMISLMEYELKGRTLGWRPNDIIFGQFTDNVNNYQLGVLEAIRFTTQRLKDSLTRMGDADTYDPDLERALHLFMNSATKFWFPSAESCYTEAVELLKRFVEKLKTGKRNFYYRKDNLVLLFSTYRDLLGNVNRSLITPMGWFETDDAFYYAKGVAHVYYEILRVVRVGFEQQLGTTLYAKEMLDEIIHELHRAEVMDPWIILDADLGGLLANHRANLNAPLSEVAHLLVVLSQL